MVLTELKAIREGFTAGVRGDLRAARQASDDLLKLGLRTFNSIPPEVKEYRFEKDGIEYDYGMSWFTKSGTNTVDRARALMSEVEPLPFVITYVEGPIDREDPYLHAWNVVADPTDAEDKLRLADELGWLGSPMSPTVYTLCAAACFEFESNPLIRNLKYWMDTFPEGEEPLRTKPDGKSFVTKYDLMSHKRWLTLLTGAIAYDHAIRQGTGIGPLILEQTRYLFQDPDWHTKKLKSMTGLHIQSSFSLCPGGHMVKWRGFDPQKFRSGLGTFDVVEFGPGMNDEISYSVLKKSLDENLADLLSEGLILTANFWTQNMTAHMNVLNVRAAQNVQAMIGNTGFTRTDEALSFVQQANKSEEMPPLPSSGRYPVEAMIDLEWTRVIRAAHKHGLLMSEKDFKAQLVRALTSKSAGAGLSSKVEFRVRLKTAYPNLRILKEGGRVVEFLLADKRSVFYFDPDLQLTKRLMHVSLDKDNPGPTGSRQVTQGKATRMIHVQPLATILAEFWLVPGVTRIMTTTIDYHGEREPFGTPNAFTEADTTGRTLWDQALLLWCTSDPNKLNSNADFSAFDSSQREQVSRPTAAAMRRELTALGYTGKFLDFEGGQAEMISELFENAYSSYRKLPRSVLIDDESVKYDGLPSGMNSTKAGNDLVNSALYRVFYAEMERTGLLSFMSLEQIKIQGDDFMAVYDVSRDKKDANVWTAAVHRKFVETRVRVAAENGFEINADKTSVRFWGGEYLKIYARYGCQVFLNVISHFAQERAARARDPRSEALGWNSKITTKLARGDNYYFWSRMRMARWAYARSVRSFTKDGVVHVAPPFATFFTPISMNGLGQVPWLAFGSNHDTTLRLYSKFDKQMEIYINCAATVMAFTESRVTREVADAISTGQGLEPPDLFDRGKKFVRSTMSNERMANAVKAQTRLASFGVPVPGELYYINLPEVTISEAVKSNPKLVQLAEANKVAATRAMLDNIKRAMKKGEPSKSIKSKHPLIDAFDWSLGEELEPVYTDAITPFPGHDDLADRIVRCFGVSSGADEFAVNPNDITQRIANATPMRSSATAIFNFITKPIFMIHDDLLFNALIAFGIESAEALKIASDIKKNSSYFGLKEAAAGFSLQSPLLTSLDKSRENHQRVVFVDNVANETVSNLVSEIGMLYSIAHLAKTGEFRRVYAHRRHDTDVQVSRVVQGRLFNEGDHPWTLRHNREVETLLRD